MIMYVINYSIGTDFNSAYNSIKLDTKLNPAYGENTLPTDEVYYSEIKEDEAAASYEYVCSSPPDKTDEKINDEHIYY